jgi:hypothetical protein
VSAVLAQARIKTCSLCGDAAPKVGVQRILTKYDADYFQCRRCDLIQTEAPYWLEEAPWSSIAHLDTGAVMRHEVCVRVAVVVAHLFNLDPTSTGMDYGAGSGLFVREMRDRGFDFRWWDLFAPNVFAKGFEAKPEQKHDMVTAFEFFEHLARPATELDPLFKAGHDVVLVGTVLHDGQYRPDWSYMFPAIGGHVVFYSPTTMQHIADRWNYQVIATTQHTVFYRRYLSPQRQRVLERALQAPWSRAVRLFLEVAPRYESLVLPDLRRLLPDFLASIPGATPGESPRHQVWPALKRHRWRREAAIRLARLVR